MNLRQKIAVGALTGVLGMAGAVVTWFEGRSLVAYLDPVGIPTLCDGITAGVTLNQTATNAECDGLLAAELNKALDAVDHLTAHQQPDTRRAALASFVYNVGTGAFADPPCCACSMLVTLPVLALSYRAGSTPAARCYPA